MSGSADVKRPCVGCVYYDACGNTGRTAPCEGRVTKSDRRRNDGKNQMMKEVQANVHAAD